MNVRLLAEKILPWACVLLPWAALGYGLRFSFFGLPSTALELYLAGLFVLFTALSGARGWARAWRTLPSRGLLLAWTGIGLAACVWSPSFVKGFGLWRAYVLEPVVALAVVNAVLTTFEGRRGLRNAFWTVAAFVGAWAILEFFTGKGIPPPWNVPILAGRRATGPYGFPNAVALFVVPVAAYAGARWWAFRERLAALAAVLGFAGTLVVRSDGGMLAILAAWGLAMLGARLGRRFLAAAAGIGAAAAILAPKLASMAWKGATFQGWSGKVRLIMWAETWEMLKAHWFLGAGLGGYPKVFDAFHKKRFIEIFQYPHQFVLTAWSEVGLPGLFLFLGLLYAWGRRAWAASTIFAERSIGLAPLVAILVHGLVDVPYWKNDLALTFFLLWWLVAWVDRPVSDRLG